MINLASNENPFGPSPMALRAMQQTLSHCNLYPDNEAGELRGKVAERHGLRPEQVLIGAGSTELIAMIARALLRPGLNAITSKRSFIVYALATCAAGGKLIQQPMRDNGFDLDGISGAIQADTRLVFLANPNNPTGTLFDADATEEFVARVPEHVITVLDEAYYEYAEYFAAQRGVAYSRSGMYVREGRNVVVLRTFSKVHGLAGVRIGYALGRPELLARFAEMRSTYSISLPAQAGALAALEDEGHIRAAVSANAAGGDFLSEELLRLGYQAVPTWGNFIYCDIGADAEGFCMHMKREGVLIRPLGAWGAPKAIRVTIGTPEQNQAFLAAFKRVR